MISSTPPSIHLHTIRYLLGFFVSSPQVSCRNIFVSHSTLTHHMCMINYCEWQFTKEWLSMLAWTGWRKTIIYCWGVIVRGWVLVKPGSSCRCIKWVYSEWPVARSGISGKPRPQKIPIRRILYLFTWLIIYFNMHWSLNLSRETQPACIIHNYSF